MKKEHQKRIRQAVRERYAGIVGKNSVGCGCNTPSTINNGTTISAEAVSRTLGYSEDDIQSVPEEANLGLGCGNPRAIAGLKFGETVLDLGSGAGFDCFLAANNVGNSGRVIGVNCIPCFDHLYSKAKEINMDDEEIKEIVEIAGRVKIGASAFLKKAISDVVGNIDDPRQPCCGPLKSGCN